MAAPDDCDGNAYRAHSSNTKPAGRIGSSFNRGGFFDCPENQRQIHAAVRQGGRKNKSRLMIYIK
jgi:hypothetical protein